MFSNISLQPFMPILVSLTCPSLQILDKTQVGGISDIQISGQSIIKENYHNSRTSNDIDMKLGPVTKRVERNMTTSKKLTRMSCRKIVMPLLFFRFMANLEQSAKRIRNAWSVKLTFSLVVIFFLTKTEIRTKIFLTQLAYHCFE